MTNPDMSDEKIVRQAVRNVDKVALNLEYLARRLRKLAERYESVGRSLNKYVVRAGAVGVSSEIVAEYTQAVGNNGTHLWGVIHSAQALDAHRNRYDESAIGLSEEPR